MSYYYRHLWSDADSTCSKYGYQDYGVRYSFFCSEMAQISEILDPRFGNDIFTDADVLRRYVVLPPEGNKQN